MKMYVIWKLIMFVLLVFGCNLDARKTYQGNKHARSLYHLIVQAN